MYNRYIPRDGTYTRVTVEDGPPPGPPPEREESPPPPPPGPGPGSGPGGPGVHPPFDLSSLLFGRGEGNGGISALLKALKLDSLDSGDILLLLIVLFLLVEGDDIELVIALGLVLIMGLNGEEKQEP